MITLKGSDQFVTPALQEGDRQLIPGQAADVSPNTDPTSPLGAPSQAPVIGNLDGDSVTYTEDANTYVLLDLGSNATVSDPDSGNFNGGSLTIAATVGEPTRDRFGIFQDGTVSVTGNEVRVNGVLIGTATGVQVVGSPLVITFTTDDATPERVQLLMQKIFYGALPQQDPISGDRTVTLTLVDGDGVADGGSDTATATVTVTVVGINDAPAGADRTITINEDVARALLVADFGFDNHGGSTQSESQSLQAVIITTLPTGGTLYIDTDGAGVGDLGTAVTAGQSVSAADIIAGRLVYVPAANANGVGAASFTFQVQDDGGTANGGVDTDDTPNTITFDITAVNDAPVIGNLSGDTTSFTEGGSLFSAMLDAGLDVTVSDADNANFDGGSLRIQVTNAVAGEDFIYFNNSNPAFGLTFSGNTLSYDGVAFATFTAPSADRTFTFDANATPEAVQSLMRSLAYYNSNSLNPSSATRTVTFTLNDGSGGSTSVSTSVNVAAVNDEPAGADNTVTGSEDSGYVFTVADFGFSDADGNGFFGVNFLTVPATGTLYWDPDGPGGSAAQVVGTGWNIEGPTFATHVAAGALYYVPEPDESGAGYASFSFQVKDNGGLANGGDDTSATYTMTIDVEAVNDAPVVTIAAPSGFGPVGTEILVNTATANAQDAAQITTLSNGGFVVTWQDSSVSNGGATGDTSGYAVKAQVFAAGGAPVGTEILVNTATSGSQSSAQITALADGGFVVTWQDGSAGVGGATGDTSSTAIKAQVFAADGTPVGTEVRVNTATAGNQLSPQITALADGGFVVTWHDNSLGVGGATGDTSSTAIKAQVFAADGTPVGTEVLVNTATTGSQSSAQITALTDGGFVVTWQDNSAGAGGATGDTSSSAVKAQVFAADGTPVGTEILVNTATTNTQNAPQITALADGGFLVTWQDFSQGVGGATGDVSSWAVKAQVFAAGGTPVGTEILVNTATTGSQEGPQITTLADGGFVVTWRDQSAGVGGTPGDASGLAVKAQVFAAGGTPVGTEILVNTATADNQFSPQITALADGGFVVIWIDYSAGVGGATGDADGSAIKAQVFAADGTPVGTEMLVNTATAGNQLVTQITALPDGGFVVTWQDLSQGVGGATGDVNSWAVKAQVFGPLPASFEATEQTALSLKGAMTVSDVDAGASTLTATLSVGYGLIDATAGNSGVTIVSGNGTGSVIVSGTQAQLSAFLGNGSTSTIAYTPDTDAPPASTTITLSVNDGGNTGDGGAQIGSASETIVIAAEDDAPVLDLNGVAAGVDNTAAYTEQAPIVTLASGLVLSDDGGTLTGATVRVTGGFVPLAGDGADYLGISGSGSGTINGITYIYSALTGILTLSGTATVAAYQAVLAQVSFQSSTNNPGATKTITWTVNDGSSTSAPVTTTITVTEVNDAPVNTVPGAQNGTEDRDLVFSTGNGNAVSVSDRDATTLTVTLAVANGVLTLSGTAGLSFGTGDGSDDATMTFTGTAAAINAALNGLIYRGDLNYSGGDTLTVTTNDGGAQDVDTVTLTLAPDGLITGDTGNNTVSGTADADVFDLSQGGDDTVSGGDGNDGFYFGGAYTSGDTVDGGGGALDQVGLQGNYSGGVTMGTLLNTELVVLLSGNDTRFGDAANNFYDYNLTTTDATVAAGQRLVVQGNTLRVGEDLTFDGSAELDGYFLMYGGHGTDVLTGGAGNDGFYFGQGRFGASDVVNGGGGTMDQLALHGDYTGANAVTFGAAQLSGLEMIVLLSATNTGFGLSGGTAAYNLTMNNANVGAGELLTISANTLGSEETLNFNGSAETDGRFQIFSGDGNDVITGGAGDDVIFGGGRGDTLYGGAGNDIFAYRSVTDSNSTERDGIQDFNAGDRIDVSRIDADIFAAGNQDFTFIGTNAFSGTAGELRFENISLGGPIWMIQGDVNGDGVSDLEIVYVTPVIRSVTVADFIGVTAGAGGAPQVLPPQEEVLTKGAEDFSGPQVLPPQDGVSTKNAEDVGGPQVLPTQGDVSTKDATDIGGPQVLPGQADEVASFKDAGVAQVLPGLTADDFVVLSKDAGGPQVLPTADTGPATKDALGPQVLPGLDADDFIVGKAAMDTGPQVLPGAEDDLFGMDALPDGLALRMAIWSARGDDFLSDILGDQPLALQSENEWGWL